MDRREAVKHIGILLGGTLVGAEYFLSGCKTNDSSTAAAFSQSDIALLDEIADAILPTTSTPGAKAAKVGQFMTVMVNDCYEEKDRKAFRDGMDRIRKLAKEQFNDNFMDMRPEQRRTMLVKLDEEQKVYTKKLEDDAKKNTAGEKKEGKPPHYFRMMKELTLLGYFTSEIGSTKARRYVETPGRFDGCVPYKKGDKAWS